MDMLIFLLAIPLIGAVLTLLMGNERAKYAKFVALAFSAATLVIAVALLFMQDDYATMGMNEVWIKTDFFQFNFKLAIDGLSILMVFLTALLVFVVGLAGGHLPGGLRATGDGASTTMRVLRHNQRGTVPEGRQRKPPLLGHPGGRRPAKIPKLARSVNP